MQNGLLHGEGKNPAFIAYDEARNIVEVVDFRDGNPVGTHLRYYPNGKESYRVVFKNGKKHGQEQFFDEEGNLLGSGLFSEGRPMGKHWRNYPDGSLAYRAEFDNQGDLLLPICEYNTEGNKVRQYFISQEKLEGALSEWYSDGILKAEYSYTAGVLDGAQKDYYPNGQLKVCTHYKDKNGMDCMKNGMKTESYLCALHLQTA